MSRPDDPSLPPLAPGDLRLLQEASARELLNQPLPAQFAYVARDGSPRVVPTWFHWDGEAVVMATWVRGPHVQRPAHRLTDLEAAPDVAISIDTDEQPPRVLQIRGRAEVHVVDGLAEEYRLAAERYIGDGARGYLADYDRPGVAMARIAVRPTWVNLIDFGERPPQALDTGAEQAR